MDYRIISIGTLSRHDLWQESGPVRTPHATTTLVRVGDRVILVDPALPPQVVAARLNERSGLMPEAVTDVFLTNFRPAHRWGIRGFDHAKWWIAELEREAIGAALVEQFKVEADEDARRMIEQDIALLKRCEPAPDRLAEQVDLFPLPGYTPGTCGLLLGFPAATVLIAGDAVATTEHLEQAKVLRGAWNVKQALESLAEAIEIADIIVPGHDNVIVNPTRRRV